jgi:transposase
MNHVVAQNAGERTIGIDIAKDTLDIHLHPDEIVRQCVNDRNGHAGLIAWVTPLAPARIVFEATGRYHQALELALGKAGLPAVKINPLQARRFAEATGKRVKTDPIDAAMLARFGATCAPRSRQPNTKPSPCWRNCSPPAGVWSRTGRQRPIAAKA